MWLKTTLQEIAGSLHLHWRDSEDVVSRDVMEFVSFTQQAVFRGMERELATVEKRHAQHKEKVSCSSQNIVTGVEKYLQMCSVTTRLLRTVQTVLTKFPSNSFDVSLCLLSFNQL